MATCSLCIFIQVTNSLPPHSIPSMHPLTLLLPRLFTFSMYIPF
jgi:hypothetical protein